MKSNLSTEKQVWVKDVFLWLLDVAPNHFFEKKKKVIVDKQFQRTVFVGDKIPLQLFKEKLCELFEVEQDLFLLHFTENANVIKPVSRDLKVEGVAITAIGLHPDSKIECLYPVLRRFCKTILKNADPEIRTTNEYEEITQLGLAFYGNLPLMLKHQNNFCVDSVSFFTALMMRLYRLNPDNFENLIQGEILDQIRNEYYFLLKNDVFITEIEMKIEYSEKFNQVWEFYTQNNFEICLSMLSDLQTRKLLNADLYNLKGMSLSRLKQYDEAIIAFDECLKLEKDHFHALNNKGAALLLHREVEKGIECIKRSYSINRENSNVFRNFGLYYSITKESSKADDYFSKAEAIDPFTELLYYYWGIASRLAGNEELAQKYFLKSKDLNENEAVEKLKPTTISE